jgi:hypothetical protein
MSERASERAIRTAMLLASSPERVYSQLCSFPREDASRLFVETGLTDLDRVLLSRNELLINIAVAQSTQDTDVLRDLYRLAATAIPSDDGQAKYFYGLRVACLSNPTEPLILARGPALFIDDNELARIISDGKEEESEALFLNPAITGLLKSLLARTNQFASLEEQRWCRLLWIAAQNERLNIDTSNEHGPDLDAHDISKSIAAFARIVPVSELGARTLISVLIKVHSHVVGESQSHHAEMLGRWREWNYEPEKEREYGRSENLKSEVLALLGAVIGSYSTLDSSGKHSSGSIASFDSTDLSERCAFYSSQILSIEQLENGYKKDGDYFLLSVFRNSSVMWNRAHRNFIEERLPNYLVPQYKHHCRLFKRDRSDFDDTMQSAELQDNPRTTETILIEKIGLLEARIGRLEGWVKSTKAWVIFASIFIGGLVILSRHWR